VVGLMQKMLDWDASGVVGDRVIAELEWAAMRFPGVQPQSLASSSSAPAGRNVNR
jgi:hypothetical protein